jgi:hypothetical protein
MANNFGTLTNTTLLNDAFAVFLADLLPLTSMILDVCDPTTGVRDAKPGDTITIKDWQQDFTAYDVGAGGYNSPTDITPAQYQITLPNNAKACSLVLSAAEFRVIESGKANGPGYANLLQRLRLAMQRSLGLAAIVDLFAVVTAANYSNYTVTAAGTFSRASEIDLDGKFFARSVPRIGAQGILAGATYLEWTKDHVAIQTNTDNTNVPRDLLLDGGKQSLTTPFRFSRTALTLPTDAPRGFLFTRTGFIGAWRTPSEATFEGDPVSLLEVVDASTGIPMLVRLWKNPQTGAIQLDIAAIWKFQKGQDAAVERLLAQAPA